MAMLKKEQPQFNHYWVSVWARKMDKQSEWNITRYTDFFHSSKENHLKHSSAKSILL